MGTIAEGELGLHTRDSTRRTVTTHGSRGDAAVDGSDDESEDDFDSVAARLGEIYFDWPAASNEPKQGTRATGATHFVRYEEVQLGKAAAQVMVLFAEKGVKEGKEITWSYGDSYRSHRKALGYRAGTRANPNAITPCARGWPRRVVRPQQLWQQPQQRQHVCM